MTKSVSNVLDAPLIAAFLTVSPTDVALVVAARPAFGFAPESPPLVEPSTLLALSCAFLN